MPELARNVHNLPSAFARHFPTTKEQVDFLITADERIETRARSRIEAALRRGFAKQAMDRHRLRRPFQDDVPARLVFEHSAAKFASGLRDDDFARACGGLEPGCEIEGFADDRPLDCHPVRTGVADHHDQARRDADANAERLAVGRSQLTDIGDDGQRRARGALRVVLARPRIVELGQDAVSLVSGDIPAAPRDDARAGILEDADNLAVVLGIKSKRQGCGSDQIAEHRGELPAFAHRSGAMRIARTSLRRDKTVRRRSRSQEPLALAQAQSEVAQIGLGQIVDRVPIFFFARRLS